MGVIESRIVDLHGLCIVPSKSRHALVACSFARARRMAVRERDVERSVDVCLVSRRNRSELVQVMRSIGNTLANSIWEANTKSRVKVQSNCSSSVDISSLDDNGRSFDMRLFSRLERERWIREKYEQKLFLAPLPVSSSSSMKQTLTDAIHAADLYTVILILAHRKFSNEDLNCSLVHVAASQGNVTVLQLLLWVRLFVEHSERARARCSTF
jgi:Arf-GAP with GTPase, ANK repeat and PH domain-containing protein 1/3/4/5/6/9/11